MGLTREEAISSIHRHRDGKFDAHDVCKLIHQIYNGFEQQLKTKDAEIERLLLKNHNLKADCGSLMKAVKKVNNKKNDYKTGESKSRSIVAMLFWMMKRQKAIYTKSFNELGINNHNTSFYKGAYENSKMRFKQAYKMLKDKKC